MCKSCEVLDGFWMGNQKIRASKLLKNWSHPPGSNRRPADYESAALPTELGWLEMETITVLRVISNASLPCRFFPLS